MTDVVGNEESRVKKAKRILSRKVVLEDKLCGTLRSPRTLDAMEERGEFPKRIYLSVTGRRVGWIEEEIDAWIEQRAKARA